MFGDPSARLLSNCISQLVALTVFYFEIDSQSDSLVCKVNSLYRSIIVIYRAPLDQCNDCIIILIHDEKCFRLRANMSDPKSEGKGQLHLFPLFTAKGF